jgi:hypothetical protein
MNISVNFSRTGWHVLLHVAFATLITMYLFYLDEGYYNFYWMRNFGNWILFLIYGSFLLFGQLLVKRFMLASYTGLLQTFLSCIIGSGLELMMAMVLFV